MALADVFYPDNPKRRDEVVRLSSKLATLLESNFKKTNDLIDCIHTYFPGKTFTKVKVSNDKSIRENCEIIQKKLQEVQTFLDEKASEIRRNVDPTIFDSLMAPDITFIERVRIAKTIAKVGELVVYSLGSIVLVALIATGTILTGIVASLGVLITCSIAVMSFGVLLFAVDMIISAIAGYYERKKLEEAIKDLRDAVNSFEPKSDKFNKDIERLIIRIEDAYES